MDDDDGHSSSRAANTPPLPQAHGLYAAPMLNDHVPQQLKTPPSGSSPDPLPTHPFDLNFPTLNDDGSVPDLTAHQSRRQHSPTPPAALSSLGARLKMENKRDDSSEYDMLDDLSEVSDGHDTASIASTAEATPDDSHSEADPEESTLLGQGDDEQVVTRSNFQSYVNFDDEEVSPSSSTDLRTGTIRAENDLIDSYMPDDLETPRQSTIASSSPSWKINQILFVSERDDSLKAVMDDICSFVAASLNNVVSDEYGTYKVVRMPATPSGISLPSAHIVRGQGSVSATIQHCIGANKRKYESFKLRILDQDEEHSSFFTIGEDAKIDLPKPDIAIFYHDVDQDPPEWLAHAQKAVQKMQVPSLVVFDSSDPMRRSRRAANLLRQHNQSLLPISLNDLYNLHNEAKLTPHISALVRHSAPAPSKLPIERPTSDHTSLVSWSAIVDTLRSRQTFQWLRPLLFVISLVLVQSFATRFIKSTDPTMDLAARREGLMSEWAATSNSSTATKTIDLDHLLPEPPILCPAGPECIPGFPYQGVSPNHIIVSLPGLSHFPQLVSTRVYKANGKDLAFNQTTLIQGVYDITLDIDQAYGEVYFNLQTKKPQRNFTATHDFGSRILQRRTYERAGIEAGKEMSKDVAFMKQKARSLSEKLPPTIGAGVWATRNVTSLIALHMARDLQVIGNTAVSMLSKAAQVSNETATTLSKDLVLMRSDLVKFTTELSTVVKSRVDSAKNFSKALIRKPIEVSRERLQGLKKATGLSKGEGQQRCRYERSEVSTIDEPEKPAVKEESKYLSIAPDYETALQQVDAAYKKFKEEQKKQEASKRETKKLEKLSKKDLRKQEKEARKQEILKKVRDHRPRGGLYG